MTYYIETYGCEMNKAESNALKIELEAIGYMQSTDASLADWLIINTCSVRGSAEERVIGRLGEFKRMKAESVENKQQIAIMGCMAERLKDKPELFKKYQVDAVIGSFDKKNFIRRLNSVSPISNEHYEFFDHHGRDGVRAYIPIMHGCNAFCTFCIVPYVRGREVSRPANEIITEITKQIAEGAKEIILLGQTVNNYQDGVVNFPALIAMIKEVRGDVWFRFTSSHPKSFNRELMMSLNNDHRFVHHIHLAAQHGSDKILKEMNRHYTANHFLSLLEMTREFWPDVAITTDLMVGFPGESDEDFSLLIEFVEKARFSDAFTYQYSDRAGSKAEERQDKVSEETKNHRLQHLIDIQRSFSKNGLKRLIGESFRVLVMHEGRDDGELFGYSEGNRNIVFRGDKKLIGEFAVVKVTECTGQTMKGILVP